MKATEIIMILDRSGSMAGLENDTIGGYNSFITKQKDIEGQALVTTVLFDHDIMKIHDRLTIDKVKPLTADDYYVRGTTALLDAVGFTIRDIDLIQKHVERPDNTIVVIMTDGYENASRHYSYEMVAKLIDQKKEEGWEFIFLGANIDAAKEAGRMGINADRAAQFHNDSKGVALNYATLERAVRNYRFTGDIDASWCDDIDDDFKNRS